MKHYAAFFCLAGLLLAAGIGCGSQHIPNSSAGSNRSVVNQLAAPNETRNKSTPNEAINKFEDKQINKTPKEWAEKVSGVKTRLATNDKVIALTFDACGGAAGSQYDQKLIEYLTAEKIPATLFINSRWIDANPDIFLQLSRNNLFEIANHGTQHKPLSVNGKTAYGIKGTGSIEEVKEEVLVNEQKILKLTGRKPKFFRPGTAFADEIAVSVVEDLGEEVVGFNILGDAGATFSRTQIRQSCLRASPGSIIIFHMNHPESETLAGIKEVIPELRKKGFRFVKLGDYPLECGDHGK
ncbi:MAG: polysaccharide deacetylase family protein [Firmicutes bacterium]|nr:polysaccharide deacetylase family protein [Bacillota bacterium]